MSLKSTKTSYGVQAQAIHWISAAMIVVLIVLGVAMTRIDGGDNTTLYRIHIGLGQSVAILTVLRVITRMREPTPAPPPMPQWRKVLFVANHYALYVGLFALAVTGSATLLASDLSMYPPNINATEVDDVAAGDAHFALAVIYTGLLGMHIAGVLSYQRSKGDVLSRMGIQIRSRTSPTNP